MSAPSLLLSSRHGDSGGIRAAGVLHTDDEVIGSPGGLYHRENVGPLHLVTFNPQLLHVFIQKLSCTEGVRRDQVKEMKLSSGVHQQTSEVSF